MWFTSMVTALRTRAHPAERAMRRCSSLRTEVRGVLSPCLARPSEYARARSTAVSRFNVFGGDRQDCFSIDAKRLVKPGDHEQQAHFAGAYDVLKRVQTIVPGRVGNQQLSCGVDLHKTRLPAARRGVQVVVLVTCRNDDKRRVSDEASAMPVQTRYLLLDGALLRLSEALTQIGEGFDVEAHPAPSNSETSLATTGFALSTIS